MIKQTLYIMLVFGLFFKLDGTRISNSKQQNQNIFNFITQHKTAHPSGKYTRLVTFDKNSFMYQDEGTIDIIERNPELFINQLGKSYSYYYIEKYRKTIINNQIMWIGALVINDPHSDIIKNTIHFKNLFNCCKNLISESPHYLKFFITEALNPTIESIGQVPLLIKKFGPKKYSAIKPAHAILSEDIKQIENYNFLFIIDQVPEPGFFLIGTKNSKVTNHDYEDIIGHVHQLNTNQS